MSHVLTFSDARSSASNLGGALHALSSSSAKIFTDAVDTAGIYLRPRRTEANPSIYKNEIATGGSAGRIHGYMLRSSGEDVITLVPGQAGQYTAQPTFDRIDTIGADDMSSAPTSRMDTFLLHTLPIMGTIVVAVLGSAWVLFTRLDDGIDDARKEAKADLQVFSARADSRFDRVDTRLQTIEAKLDEKASELIKQMSDLRVRQTQIELKN